MKQFLFLVILFLGAYAQGQQQKNVDFTTAKIDLTLNSDVKSISGAVVYQFKALEKTNTFFLDAKNMDFTEVKLNNKPVKYEVDAKKITIKKKLKKGTKHTLSFNYSAKPKQTLYFIDESENSSFKQIWTQGQGKYTSHWLPSFDDMNEKVEFDVTISFDKNYEVIANGRLTNKQITESNAKWHFDMEKPMSSYLLALAIGNYEKKELRSNSGIPIKLYYYPEDSLKVEPTYRYSKEIFDFLEAEIGVLYPWKVYKQIPVKDFLYAGMENTSATIFSDAYMVDSIGFLDRNYVNINAHELAHQWFGDLVTEVDSNHHWLHEGFATYYAYLAEKELLGDDYFYWKLYDTGYQLQRQSDKGVGESLLNPKASSLTFYEKGAWALFALQSQIGEQAFKKGMKTYLEKYQFKNVTVTDFLSEMKLASGQDLSDYKEVWLTAKSFPKEKARNLLRESSKSIASFYKMQRELSTTKKNNAKILDRYWKKSTSIQEKKHILKHYSKSISENLKQSIFASNNVELRQALLLATDKIDPKNKANFETFLTDKSYATIENALYKLWIRFPEKRADYLNTTKGVIGFKEKNVRQLWLALAILTNGFEAENKQNYLKELRSYTAPKYHFEARQIAFSYLKDLFNFDNENLKDLLKATNHQSWRFKKFARSLVDELLKKDTYLKKMKSVLSELNPDEKRYIDTKLKQ